MDSADSFCSIHGYISHYICTKLFCIFTDRVRSTRGGNIFSLFVCSQGGGTSSGWWGGTLSSSRWGGTLSSSRGVPCPAPGGTLSSSRWGVPYPAPGGGVPGWGTPWPGYPPWLARVPPGLGTPRPGYPPGQGTPPVRVPPGHGTPPSQGTPTPARVPPYWNIAWTCYVAVGEPLAC